MPPITTRLGHGWARALEHLPLSSVPLITAVLAAAEIRGVLAAGYFGSIRGALETGNYEFVANVRRHFVPFLLYTVAPVLAVLPLFAIGASGGARALLPAAVLLLPVVLLLSYLFYATPYLVVLRETDVVSAARASYGFAIAGGPYARYAIGLGGFVLAASLVVTALVANLGPIGIALGVVAGAPLGLACNVATMRFVADIDPASPSLETTGGGFARSGSEPDPSRAGGEP